MSKLRNATLCRQCKRLLTLILYSRRIMPVYQCRFLRCFLVTRSVFRLKETNLCAILSSGSSRGSRICLTIESNLHAGSEGCAPTPSQYLALTESSLMSLNGLPSPSWGAFGMGSYVPNTAKLADSSYLSISFACSWYT